MRGPRSALAARTFAALGAAVFALGLSSCTGTPRDAGLPAVVRAGDVSVAVGAREILLPAGAFGMEYFPDENVLLLSRDPLQVLVTAKFSTWLVGGDDFRSLDHAVEVLTPGEPRSFDNGYAGVGGVHRATDAGLYAFYHAEDHEGMPTLPAGMNGFYGRVGLALSRDEGRSWEKLGPVLSGARPKHFRAFPGQGSNGVGIPSVVADREGRHLLLYYNEFSQVDGRGVQIFLARAPLAGGPPVAGRWHKYHQGDFSEPGLGGEETAVLSGLRYDGSNALFPSVVFSRDLDRYVMILCIDYWKRRMQVRDAEGRLIRPELEDHESGVYVAFSRDGITWSDPTRLFADWAMPRLGGSVSWEPSLVFDDESGREGWLLYGYSDAWGDPRIGLAPHHMAGRRIRFER